MNFICSVMVVVCLTYLSGIVVAIEFDRKIKDFNPTITCEPKYGFYQKGLSTKQFDKTSQDWFNLLKGRIGGLRKISGSSERYGEFVSWATALAFIGAGISNVVSIISPGVGLFSWIAGLVVQYKDNKEKEKFVKNLQGALASISNDMSLRFENMKHYVDQSTLDFEKSVLGGEFQQMYEYLSDCMETDELSIRSRCLVDRCSYVRSGFKKFAIYYDELSEDYQESVKASSFRLKQWKNLHKQKYKKLTVLQVKRIQANMPMFANYVQSLLIPCESVRVFYGVLPDLKNKINSGQYQEKQKWKVMAQFKKIENKGSFKWKLKDMIYNYMNNANQVISAGYEDYGIWEKEDKENPRKVIAYGGYKKNGKSISLKCRMRMNPMNFDTCDIEEEVNHKTYTNNKKKYNGNVDAILKDYCEKWSWEKADLYKKYYDKVDEKIQQNDVWHKLAKNLKTKLEKLYKAAENSKVRRGQ